MCQHRVEFYGAAFGFLCRSQFHAIQRKPLSDKSKAPLTRSTPKPELQAECEARSLIHFLRADGHPQSEWLAALSADQTLSEPIRQRALQFARDWKSLWSAVCQHSFGIFGVAFGFPCRSDFTPFKESRSAKNPKLR